MTGLVRLHVSYDAYPGWRKKHLLNSVEFEVTSQVVSCFTLLCMIYLFFAFTFSSLLPLFYWVVV